MNRQKERASALLQSGRPGEAMEILEPISREARLDPDVWHLLAACYGMQGDYGKCETCARQAVSLMPSLSGAWCNLGIALHAQGRLPEAEAALREAIAREPGNAQSHNNLGNVCREMGKSNEAERCFREALRLQPDFPDVLTNLGLMMQDRGALKEAAALHRRALSLNPRHVAAHINLGYALILIGERDSAVPHLDRARQLQPNKAQDLCSLGRCYLAIGKREVSVTALTRALELNPGDDEIRYWLAAAGGGKAPDKMAANTVVKLFDSYADKFDEDLVGRLRYRTPGFLSAALRRALGNEARSLAVLDLGCGTGLLGAEVTDIAGYLAGVDLSPEMVERARTRGIYQDLAVRDIADYMEAASRRYDAILSADVFVYLGDLGRVFSATSACLRPGGLFAFSVEADTRDAPYSLRASGRYAHSLGYLRELTGRHGFTEVQVETVTHRLDNGAPIDGYVVVLRRL